jgi:hypothetical protein
MAAVRPLARTPYTEMCVAGFSYTDANSNSNPPKTPSSTYCILGSAAVVQCSVAGCSDGCSAVQCVGSVQCSAVQCGLLQCGGDPQASLVAVRSLFVLTGCSLQCGRDHSNTALHLVKYIQETVD